MAEGRAQGRGVSEVLNDLARRGLAARGDVRVFRQRRRDLGAPAVPLDDTAAALSGAEGDDRA